MVFRTSYRRNLNFRPKRKYRKKKIVRYADGTCRLVTYNSKGKIIKVRRCKG